MIDHDYVPLSQHELIAETECAEIAARVVDLRPHWTRRSERSFYSLGAASYLDFSGPAQNYFRAARHTNDVLRREFGHLYRSISAFFEALLDDHVGLDADRAAPGFHIFEYDGAERGRDDPAPRAHFDLQWQHAYPGRTARGTLSFTLLIEAPSGGASMAVWNLRYGDALAENSREQATRQKPQCVSYAPGWMVIHDGLILHAIGAASPGRMTGRRITLQGHGIRFDHGWLLYW